MSESGGITRRRFLGLGATCAIAAFTAGCSPSGSSAAPSASSSSSASSAAPAASTAKGGKLRLMTGGQTGTYYSFGRELARHATEHAGIEVTALLSDGSKENVEALVGGQAELCFCQADVMAYAYEGTNLFDGVPLDTFCSVAALYDEQVQIIACDPDVKSVDDLKGKRVSVGAPDSGVGFNALDVLSVYGLSFDDITPTYEPFGDSAASLKEGRIDAAFVVAGAPTEVVASLFDGKTAHLVPIGKKCRKKLTELSPNYVEATIPAGTYAGQDKDCATVAVSAAILAANSVASDDVYTFVKDVFETASDESAASAHEMYGKVSVEKAASLVAAPYHPGAAKFFEEQGLKVETA